MVSIMNSKQREDSEVLLSEISSFITKGATPTTYGFNWQSSGIPFLRSECVSSAGLDLRQSKFISEGANKALRRSQVNDGDILMTITGNVGRVVRLTNLGLANINQHIARIRVSDEQFDPGYVFHYLSQPHIRTYFESITTGQAYPQISLVQVRQTKICAINLKQQREIAKCLDDCDQLISSIESLISKKNEIKRGMMQQLLAGQSRLPSYQGEWSELSLGDVAIGTRGSGLSKSAILADALTPCLLYGELFTTYGPIIESVKSYTAEVSGVQSAGGEVLIPGSTTTTAKDLATASALLQRGVLIGGDVNIISPNQLKVDSAWLAYYLTSQRKRQIAEMGQGTTIVHLYVRSLLGLSIELPSIAEQKAIVEVLRDSEAEIAALEERLKATRLIKQGMMQELLTGRSRPISTGE